MSPSDTLRIFVAAGLTTEQILLAVKHLEVTAELDADAPAPKRKKGCSNAERRASLGLSDWKWRKLRAQVLARDGHQCVYCRSTDKLACDHIIPLSRGGTNDVGNLEAVCGYCNSSKGAKTPQEWLQ